MNMIPTRCAACKYLRRRCPSDCIFAPYFPSNNPQRFAFVHKIFGASNAGKMLKELPVHHRSDAADSLHYEAQSRIQNPVYGCVAIISYLQNQLQATEQMLAMTQAQITLYQQANLQAQHVQVQAQAQNQFNFNNNILQDLHMQEPFNTDQLILHNDGNIQELMSTTYPNIQDPGLL